MNFMNEKRKWSDRAIFYDDAKAEKEEETSDVRVVLKEIPEEIPDEEIRREVFNLLRRR